MLNTKSFFILQDQTYAITKDSTMINRPISYQPVHISYRLFGSLPTTIHKSLQTALENQLVDLSARRSLPLKHLAHLSLSAYLSEKRSTTICNFLLADKFLDIQKEGPMFLGDNKAKQIIINSWHHIAKQYNLTIYAISVMSNHVHVLLAANDEEAELDYKLIMERHKHFTATKINKFQGSLGRRVWAKIAFDVDVRPGRFERTLWYVLNNPKKAGLCEDIFNWAGNWWNPILDQEYVMPYRLAC